MDDPTLELYFLIFIPFYLRHRPILGSGLLRLEVLLDSSMDLRFYLLSHPDPGGLRILASTRSNLLDVLTATSCSSGFAIGRSSGGYISRERLPGDFYVPAQEHFITLRYIYCQCAIGQNARLHIFWLASGWACHFTVHGSQSWGCLEPIHHLLIDVSLPFV